MMTDPLIVGQFNAAPETTYYILLHGYFSEGIYNLKIIGKPPSENYFALIDAKTDRAVEEIDTYISYANTALTSPSLNIEAVFKDQKLIRSVQVTFDDPPISFCDNEAPFSIFRDNNGDFRNTIIPVGTRTVTATSYGRQACKGRAGVSISETIDVFDCGLYLSVTHPDPICSPIQIVDGIFSPHFCNFNIELDAECGFDINHVTFVLSNANSTVHTLKVNQPPYFLFGTTDGVKNNETIVPGEYMLAVDIDGIQQAPIEFTVVDIFDGCI